MAAYQAGDAASFDALYAALAPRLRRYLTGLARDAALTEDLLQEVFLRFHRARHTHDPALPLLPWAYAIARNVFLMECRRRGRRPRESPMLEGEPEPTPMTTTDLTAAHDVERALGRLQPESRQAIDLHHLGGHDFAEVAARLGISEGAARARSHRGMEALRRFFRRRKP